MSLFQLDPASIAARVQATGQPARIPTLFGSMIRGKLGFIGVSLGGLAPWPIINRWFPWAGEMGLYLSCTVMFIALSGLLLHRLIIGPGSLPRFYGVFALGFIAYAASWVGIYVLLREERPTIAGLGGAIAMGLVIAFAFGAWRQAVKIIFALFVLIGIGFHISLWLEEVLGHDLRLLAMALWALIYGGCFGAALGLSFYFAQDHARAALGVT
jgi:hypothetical protein